MSHGVRRPSDGAGDPAQLERNLRFLAVAATREDRLVLLSQIGEHRFALARYREAEQSLREAHELAEELVDRRVQVTSLVLLARTVSHLNRHADACELFERALTLAVRGGPLSDLEADTREHYGHCLLETGRREEAVACFERALELRRSSGDRASIASTEKALHTLGVAAVLG